MKKGTFTSSRKILAWLMICACVISGLSESMMVSAATTVTAETLTQKVIVETPSVVENSKNALWIDGSNYSEDSNLDVIKWHYESRDGKYYFYLPSCVDLNNVTLWNSFSNAVYVNGTKVENGATTNIFAGGGDFTVTSGSTTYKLTVMKSENINTMFLTTESGSLDSVHASKSNKDSGNVVYVDKNGKAEQVGLEQIKGRGNSSWKAAQELFYKYPYNIKLDSKVKLFGMEKSKKWCLLANDFDQSLIRNKFVFDLAEDAGMAYTPEAEYADVYQNGRYIGNYLITSKVEIDSKRIDIYDLEGETEDVNSEDLDSYTRGGSTGSASAGTYKYYNIPNNPEDITGGYLLEFELDERYPNEVSGFVSDRRQQVVVKTPEFASKKQVEYIREYFQKMEDAVYSTDGYNSEGIHYTEYMDITSAAKMYIIEELTMDNDANATSFYCYKDTEDVIKFGPVWDFDWSMGGVYEEKLLNTNSLYVQNKTIYNNGTQKCLLAALCMHEDFLKEVQRVWKEDFYPLLQVSTQQTAAFTDNVLPLTEYASTIKASANMNFNRFRFLGTTYWGSAYTGKTFEENVNYVDKFVKNRVEFLNTYFTGLSQEQVVYFDNSSSKWSEVYAYVWNDTQKVVVSGNLVDGEKQIYKFKIIGPYENIIFKNTAGITSWNIQSKDLTMPVDELNCYKPSGMASKCYGTWYAYTEGEATPTPTIDPSSNKITLYYNSGWNNAYVHYKLNGVWTTVPGIKMKACTEQAGYTYKCTIDLGKETSATVCFNNGNGSWDSKNGANYTIPMGCYGVSTGAVYKLQPIATATPTAEPTPTVTIIPTPSTRPVTPETPSAVPTATPTAEPTATVTPTVEPTATVTPVATAVPTATVTPTAIPTPVTNKVTVYYSNSSWTKAYIHYKVGDTWTAVPGQTMETTDETSEYKWKYTIDLGKETSATVCFNNGSGSWDSRNQANYIVSTGAYGISGGVAKELDLSYQTTLAVDKSKGTIGKEVNFTATAVNGAGNYTYTFTITDKEKNEIVSETTTKNSISWTPSKEGTYDVKVSVTDKNGESVSAEIIDFEVITKNTITVYYSNGNWSQAYIHYKVNNVWTTVPGVKMQSSDKSSYTWMYTIELEDVSAAVVCFNNGYGSWDSRNGSNYALSGDKVGVKNGTVYVVE